MQGKCGKFPPHHGSHAQVLHNRRIRAGGGNLAERGAQVLHLIGLDERVHRHIHAYMVQMRIAHGRFQRLRVKVGGAGARAKCAVSQIDRVGAAVHGGAQGGLIPGGAEQFGKQQGHGRFAHFRSE